MTILEEMGKKAKEAARTLAVMGEEKNDALKLIAKALIDNTDAILAANKIDAIYSEDEDPVEKIRQEFEPQGIKVFAISAVSGKGVKELLYYVKGLLDTIEKEPVVFEQEFFPEDMLITENLPYTVYQDEEDEHLFHMEGPKIEKMLGYTNLDSEKGFSFFQRFLKDSGILEDLEKAGIQEGDTVRMYGFDFDYYK